jgi:hypothetical protein
MPRVRAAAIGAGTAAGKSHTTRNNQKHGPGEPPCRSVKHCLSNGFAMRARRW